MRSECGHPGGKRPRVQTALLLLGMATGLIAVILGEGRATPTTPTGHLFGVVRNAETMEPLPGAHVFVPELGTGAFSDSAGRYDLEVVAAGERTLRVVRIGFRERLLRAFVADGPLEIDVALEPQPIPLAPVDVRANVALPGVARPVMPETTQGIPGAGSPDRLLTMNEIRQHPLLAEPDALEAFGGGAVVVPLESPTGLHIHGGESDQTSYQLDGIPVFSPYHAAGVFSAWNPDALSRLEVRALDSGVGGAHALSGQVDAMTRPPSEALTARWSLSSGQARLTADGPLGRGGTGFLLALRSDFPDLLAPGGDPTFITGRTGDALATVEAPLAAGRLRLLGYHNRNRLTAVAGVPDSTGSWPDRERNRFGWGGHALGAEWSQVAESGGVQILAWQSVGDADARWRTASSPLTLVSRRRDLGLSARLTRGRPERAFDLGVRVERMLTEYRVTPDSAALPALELGARTHLITLFADRRWPLAQALEARVGMSLASVGSAVHASPRARLMLAPTRAVRVTASLRRTHQFAQSLRNAESVVGALFPADLFVGSATHEVPVARSDFALLGVEFLPSATFGITAQAWTRASRGLVLVAAAEGAPFATGEIATGRGTAHGLSLEATRTGRHFGVVAGYGWQEVRQESRGLGYRPDHGAGHLLQGGFVWNAGRTASIRLGMHAALGRRGTPIANGFEWEACNLLDQGCEFAGSPDHGDAPPGSIRLPGYLRIDIGARKSWTFRAGGHDASIALFGTVTNLLNRRNILTYSSTGEGGTAGVRMRPLAPLLVGVEGRF